MSFSVSYFLPSYKFIAILVPTSELTSPNSSVLPPACKKAIYRIVRAEFYISLRAGLEPLALRRTYHVSVLYVFVQKAVWLQ